MLLLCVAHLDVLLIRAIALGSVCHRQEGEFLLYQAVIVMDHNSVAHTDSLAHDYSISRDLAKLDCEMVVSLQMECSTSSQ